MINYRTKETSVITIVVIVCSFLLNVIRAQSNFLDPSFGNTGKTFITINGGEYAKDIKLQSDGKAVVLGSTSMDNGATLRFCIARLHSNGSLDNTFGNGGFTETLFGNNKDLGKRLAILSDGKIIACGTSDANGYMEFAAARYNANGTIDNSFGTNGVVLTSASGESDCKSMALQSDGKFILAGAANASSMAGDFAMIRYNANGTIDNSFGTNGVVITAVSNDYFDGINDIAIQPNGKIIAVGRFLSPAAPPTFKTNMAVMRYNANGTVDNTFGLNGMVTPTLTHYSYPSSVKIQSDGKIMVFGTADSMTTLIRLNADGSYDPSFGTNGVSSNKLIASSGFASFYLPGEIKVLNNGKYLVIGTELSSTINYANPIMTLFNANGTIDTNFGLNGTIMTGCVRDENDSYLPLEILPDRKIITAASTGNYPSSCKIYVERYSPSSEIMSVQEFTEDGMMIYPNPAKEKICLGQNFNGLKYEVFDAIGNRVENIKLEDNTSLNIKELSPGMYFIRMQGSSSFKRFIKE